MNWIRMMASVIMVGVMSACSQTLTKPVLDVGGQQMIDIYRDALDEGAAVDEVLKNRAREEHIAEKKGGGKSSELEEMTVHKHKRTSKAYRNKSYTELNGRYYDKATGTEITQFQCGLTTRIQSTPCGAGYGFGRLVDGRGVPAAKRNKQLKNDPKHTVAARVEKPAGQVSPQPAKTVKEAHNKRGRKVGQCREDSLYCGFSRTSENEIDQLFPRLSNPDIVVYVTPHLATHNKVPIPGYTTAFPLYDEVHYAMPGERQHHE